MGVAVADSDNDGLPDPLRKGYNDNALSHNLGFESSGCHGHDGVEAAGLARPAGAIMTVTGYVDVCRALRTYAT